MFPSPSFHSSTPAPARTAPRARRDRGQGGRAATASAHHRWPPSHLSLRHHSMPRPIHPTVFFVSSFVFLFYPGYPINRLTPARINPAPHFQPSNLNINPTSKPYPRRPSPIAASRTIRRTHPASTPSSREEVIRTNVLHAVGKNHRSTHEPGQSTAHGSISSGSKSTQSSGLLTARSCFNRPSMT